jgi:hypothetical protein
MTLIQLRDGPDNFKRNCFTETFAAHLLLPSNAALRKADRRALHYRASGWATGYAAISTVMGSGLAFCLLGSSNQSAYAGYG